MDDLRPILENHPSPAESRLLGAACLDVPPADGAARMVAALGLTATGVMVAQSAAAASAAAGKGVGAAIGKWLAVGALAGTVVTGTGQLVRSAVESREAPSADGAASSGSTRRAVVTRRTVTAPTTLPHGNETPARAFEDPAAETRAGASLPVAPPPEPRRAAALPAAAPDRESRTAAIAPPEPAPGLADEVRVLDAARTSLAGGDAARALATLDGFDARFARPVLAPEAALLRVEALLALGRRGEARALGERFLARRPGGPEAQRMKSLVESSARDFSPPR